MSIKSELKAKLQEARNSPTPEERQLECTARAVIDDMIIPKFREIAKSQPLSSYLSIEFYSDIEGSYCTSNIPEWKLYENSILSYDVILKAIAIAKDYDVEGEVCDSGNGTRTLRFFLDLDT